MSERTTVGTVEDLHASATRLTGLTDFGGDDYTEALGVLLDSYHTDEQLTPLGSKVSRVFLRGALVARLLSEAAWKQHPEHADVRIERPIFVTGLPRTGTTALHRLLTADPSHQGLEMWLTEMPQPRPPRETWDSNPVFQKIEESFSRHHIERPEFMGVHYMSAGEVEECWQLLRQTFKSISYECLASIPTYSRWLEHQDWTNAYQRHKKNLQLIGLPDRDRRWVLKNPSHLFALDELLAVYPDALIIQTHRPPRTIVPSVCSLAEQATEGWSEKFRGSVIGESQLELWARGLEQFTAARAEHNPAQFIDVDYHDFVADPLGTVDGIYTHFGLELTAQAQGAMAAMHADSRRGDRRPSHRYTLEEFGLTAEQVDERFANYQFSATS
ncbi:MULTISPECIES: sulfotransferase [unclassified Rhodococcus (in: high G+C Gram-positive bacteria)]|uniref:sulfotransferase family protein n=1 Tax=unclassified Rhodococcus (in: high G+C Gram-positive bacteria) TaxID=192944 RepID=UPI00163AC682|nr:MULTISPECIES: sulfotransferase [unclassified Rhodococcus (in: high G+C Gram-positive bacteria)]MBC2638957.1 sulfotransferase [Rhodococcus sp. 3A]MBC2896302.1 sulfotransferase [Rhodococcus sp. 4CII]